MKKYFLLSLMALTFVGGVISADYQTHYSMASSSPIDTEKQYMLRDTFIEKGNPGRANFRNQKPKL